MKHSETTEAMNNFRDKCQEHGLRVTPQRILIYKELIKSEDHPSADVLYKRVRKAQPSISFDTVFRTVQSFTEISLVGVCGAHGGPKRFDPLKKMHHHFICTNCDKIMDFYSEVCDKVEIPKAIQKKYNILGKKVVLEGICPKCKNKRRK